jgi:hypothetical protein
MKFVTKWKNTTGDYRDEEMVRVGNDWLCKPQPPIPFGDIVKQVVILEHDYGCIQDLHSGSFTYAVDLCKTAENEEFVRLLGNGWVEELGFPYSDEYGGYPLISGKTAEKMRDLACKNILGDWKDVYSGDINDLALDKEKVVRCEKANSK